MSKCRVALLTALATLSALQLGGCWGFGLDSWYQRIVQGVVIGNLFD